MNNWLIYLVEVSLCHALLYLLYHGLFRNLSFFQINRIYLLIAAILGFTIPAIQIPFWENHVAEIISLPINEAPVHLNKNSNTKLLNWNLPGCLAWFLLLTWLGWYFILRS